MGKTMLPQGERGRAEGGSALKMLDNRFWSKVKKDQSSGCWNWMASTAHGYGAFYYKNHLVRAHRIAYENSFGLIPKGFEIDHLCNNRGCVNPEHMEIVTRSENLRRITDHKGSFRCGHPANIENTRWKNGERVGRRMCRICWNAYRRKLRQRKKEENLK